ncbi:hypothetical protein ABZ153_30450 [Streptomyces sp. NPDC006290]
MPDGTRWAAVTCTTNDAATGRNPFNPLTAARSEEPDPVTAPNDRHP